eukprot:896856_1
MDGALLVVFITANKIHSNTATNLVIPFKIQVVISFKMQGMIPFKIQGVGYPNKLREIAYLWIVTCKDADCEMDQWSKRIDYNKYTKHYNKEHKQSWGNDKTISNVPNIMTHIRVVSIWVKQNDIDVDAKQRHMYHE